MSRYLASNETDADVARWLADRSDPANQAPPGHEGGYGYPDPDIFPLADALNAIPGVATYQSCAGHVLTDTRDGTPYHQPGQLWLRLSESMMAAFTDHVYTLLESPLIERCQRIFHQDLGDVVDIIFHGNERGKLAESGDGIVRFFTDLSQYGPVREALAAHQAAAAPSSEARLRAMLEKCADYFGISSWTFERKYGKEWIDADGDVIAAEIRAALADEPTAHGVSGRTVGTPPEPKWTCIPKDPGLTNEGGVDHTRLVDG